MATGFRITCANKNQHGVIVRVGGQGWSLSTHEAVRKLMSQQIRLHIHLGNEYFDIGVRGDGTEAHLVLEPTGIPLEELPGC